MFRVQATAYDRHVGRYSSQLAAGFCDFARVVPGMRALDVGCGPGALTAELARRLGVVNVVAAEPSESFAAACRSRVPGIELVAAAAEALSLPDSSFDTTLSQLVVNFLDDARAGVREMARVTRDGGIAAACVWDYAGEMRLLRAFWDAAREVSPEGAAEHDEGTRMPHCRDGELGELWEDAGLRDVRTGALRVRARYEDFEDLWSPFTAGVGPSGAFCASLDETGRAALHDALRATLGVDDQPFDLTARAWAVAGTVG
jgi:SAM-dependent methyltransferase